MKFKRSEKLYKEALNLMPGGVNSPVRAFRSVNMNPLFIQKAKGSYIYDTDGNKYIDYVGSWGPMIIGHAHPKVIKSISEAAKNGTSFGASCELEIMLAKMIVKFFPSIEMVRMVNSGTEAALSAVRLARAFTGRDKIIKFEGCYHGHNDSFLIKAGSGVATLGLPDSPGVTKSTAQDTLSAVYNDIESVYRLVEQNKDKVAAVIIEPVAGNMGCVPARKDFLQKLRGLCTSEKIVFIFDEVMTGFRVAKGGAQELYGIKPDLTTLGKIIGGGLPVGAYGGIQEIMSLVAPSGPVYQAGTLSGNPLAMSAGYHTLKIIDDDKKFYSKLNKSSELLYEGIKDVLKKRKMFYTLNKVGSMFTLFFAPNPVNNYEQAKRSDSDKFAKFFKSMINCGVYLPPSQFEACFVSSQHSSGDIDKTVKAIYKSLSKSDS